MNEDAVVGVLIAGKLQASLAAMTSGRIVVVGVKQSKHSLNERPREQLRDSAKVTCPILVSSCISLTTASSLADGGPTL